MALESGTYINSLNSSNPAATDGLAFADDHMRLMKATILASFPNITGAMTATHTVLNGLDARVTAIETGVHASGTKLLFQQTAAPTGWTKDTTNYNDHAIRVVTGTAGSGGTNAFSTLDATAVGTINSSLSGSVASHVLTIAELPAHSHTGVVQQREDYNPTTGSTTQTPLGFGGTRGGARASASPLTIDNTGSGSGHTHGTGTLAVTSTFTGSGNALDVKYVDVIVASKD